MKKLLVDFENGQIRLAWAANSENASTKKIEYINRIEASRLDIDYNLLLDAVSEDWAIIIMVVIL